MAVLLGGLEANPSLRSRTSISLQQPVAPASALQRELFSPSLAPAPPPIPFERATTAPPAPASVAAANKIPASPQLGPTATLGACSSSGRSALISSGRSPRLSVVGSSHTLDYGASPSPAWHPVAAPQVLITSPARQCTRSPNYQYAAAPRELYGAVPNVLQAVTPGQRRWSTLSELELAGESVPLGGGLPEPALSATGSNSNQGSVDGASASGGGGGGGAAAVGTSGASAPSSALLAAVQLAAASSSKVEDQLAATGNAPLPTAEAGAAGRRRWASMTEEEMGGNGFFPGRKSFQNAMLPSQSLVFGPAMGQEQQLTPMRGPAAAPTIPGRVPNFAPARRRWASISDDDASPMIWPMNSPLRRAVQPPGRRSKSSTPVLGPATHPGPGFGDFAAASSAVAANSASNTFMLPEAGQYGANYSMGMAPGMGMLPGYGYQMPSCPPGAGPPGSWGVNPSTTIYAGSVVNTADRLVPEQRSGRMLNGWTVIWIGERAFRASLSMKEQIESAGFLVKVYRSHDKCCRALDKKNVLSPTTVYVASEVDAAPMLAYLVRRGATDLRLVVEAGSSAEAIGLRGFPTPEDAIVTVVGSWDEVMSALRAVSAEVAARGLPVEQPLAPAAVVSVPRQPRVVPQSEVQPARPAASSNGAAALSSQANAMQLAPQPVSADNPWTLIWISDQAFKPAAVQLKATLETLGGQVKGYKTHKNAARALDKKRALTRTVVLVSGPEAAPFLAYVASRPEIGNTRIVVEANSRSVPIVESPFIEVADSFDAAVSIVQRIVCEPGFA